MVRLFFLLTALTEVQVYATANDDPLCPIGFVQYEKSCYFYNGEPLAFSAAKRRCETQFSGQLASIHSEDEQDFLTTYLFKTLKVNRDIWLGGQTDFDTHPYTLTWLDDSPFNYTNWMPGQPWYRLNGTPIPATHIVLQHMPIPGEWSMHNRLSPFGSLCKRAVNRIKDNQLVYYVSLNVLFGVVFAVLLTFIRILCYKKSLEPLVQ
ncbi:Galactose-specific lectin nattectin [Halotydeus destructor]|nr:Galactose-specific lectin nattectin [Halotydeus destructor]